MKHVWETVTTDRLGTRGQYYSQLRCSGCGVTARVYAGNPRPSMDQRYKHRSYRDCAEAKALMQRPRRPDGRMRPERRTPC